MFLFKKKTYWNKSTSFFSNLVYSMYNSGSLFSDGYSHTTQIAAVNERRFFFQNVSCQKAEVHLTQRKREITEMTFLSGKSFCRIFFPQSYSEM